MKKAILYLKDGTRKSIEIVDDHLERFETWREFERRIIKMLKRAHPEYKYEIDDIHIFRN